MKVYVVVREAGHEWCESVMAAFRSEDAAEAYAERMNNESYGWYYVTSTELAD